MGYVLAIIGWAVVLAVTVVLCIVLFVFAFAAPRRSRGSEHQVEDALAHAEEGTDRRVPGRLGDWLRKPFSTSRKATEKTAEAGRKSREKAPF